MTSSTMLTGSNQPKTKKNNTHGLWMAIDFVLMVMDTATWVPNSFLQISAASQCFVIAWAKNDEKHEGSSGAGGCSLSMHLGEYSLGERRHKPHRVQRGEETRW